MNAELQMLLDQVYSTDAKVRLSAAAALSKIAAQAEDDVLEEMSAAAPIFVELLALEEPMLRAYMACVIANVAFLELGQTRVREAGAIPHIIHLLRQKDKKVQLHATASVQNLTYKNDVNCRLVLEQDGERALNKLLRHKSEDIQQYAAGALSNLQLYQRSKGPDAPQPKQRSQPQQQQPAGWPYGEEERAMPHGSGGMGGVGSASATVSKGSTDGMLGANKYANFRVNDARTQLDSSAPSGLPPIGGSSGRPLGLAQGGGGGGLFGGGPGGGGLGGGGLGGGGLGGYRQPMASGPGPLGLGPRKLAPLAPMKHPLQPLQSMPPL